MRVRGRGCKEFGKKETQLRKEKEGIFLPTHTVVETSRIELAFLALCVKKYDARYRRRLGTASKREPPSWKYY